MKDLQGLGWRTEVCAKRFKKKQQKKKSEKGEERRRKRGRERRGGKGGEVGKSDLRGST